MFTCLHCGSQCVVPVCDLLPFLQSPGVLLLITDVCSDLHYCNERPLSIHIPHGSQAPGNAVLPEHLLWIALGVLH